MSPKDLLLTAARGLGLSALAARASAGQLPILCYHGLWVTPGIAHGDRLFMAPAQFEARMVRLKASGRPVLPLDDAVERLAVGRLPPAAVVITIDDGWVSTLTHMLPVLERLGLPATLYATTWYAGRALPVVNAAVDYLLVAGRRPDLARETIIAEIESLPVDQRLTALRAFGGMLGVDEAWLETRQFNLMSADELVEAQRRGLDIQLHTHRHIDVATRVDELAGELADNHAFLADGGITGLTHFCYPGGGSHPRARDVLAAAGVKSATLVEEGRNAPGADPYLLRRFLDGRTVSDVTFDAYLDGTLHYLDRLRGRSR